MTEHKFYCGDNVKVMKDHIEDESIDLVITSPPYDDMDSDFNPISKNGLRDYDSFQSWDFKGLVNQFWRVLKDGGVCVWVMCDPTIDGSESLASAYQKIYFRKVGFNIHDTMIYEIAGTGAKGSNYAYWQTWEYMFVFSKGTPKTVNRIQDVVNSVGGKKRTNNKISRDLKSRIEREGVINPMFSIRSNIWRYAVGQNKTKVKDHPAPFPEPLAIDHIKSWTNEGDLILDPFCGSGTTNEAAFVLNRNSIGIDTSEHYIEDIAKDRLKKAHMPLFLSVPKQQTLVS